MAEGERALQETLVVNINHVKWYDNDLAEQIEIEWLRLEPRLRQAVQRLVREVAPEFVKGDDQNEREFYIAWEGFNNIERLRDLRSAKVCSNSKSSSDSCDHNEFIMVALPDYTAAP
jgi:DNA replicative helicase MCM subunit Mcm2 (Cdc46/Mcm family)